MKRLRKTIFHLFTVIIVLVHCGRNLQAQPIIDYDVIVSDNKEEVIYQGTCSYKDLSTIPAFQWQEQVTHYQPDTQAIAYLSRHLAKYELKVFLGTWCSDSHFLIPRLYKVAQKAGYPVEEWFFYVLDQHKKGRHREEQLFNITLLPTIILMKDGGEVGRITETVQESIEADLVRIIQEE